MGLFRVLKEETKQKIRVERGEEGARREANKS